MMPKPLWHFAKSSPGLEHQSTSLPGRLQWDIHEVMIVQMAWDTARVQVLHPVASSWHSGFQRWGRGGWWWYLTLECWRDATASVISSDDTSRAHSLTSPVKPKSPSEAVGILSTLTPCFPVHHNFPALLSPVLPCWAAGRACVRLFLSPSYLPSLGDLATLN